MESGYRFSNGMVSFDEVTFLWVLWVLILLAGLSRLAATGVQCKYVQNGLAVIWFRQADSPVHQVVALCKAKTEVRSSHNGWTFFVTGTSLWPSIGSCGSVTMYRLPDGVSMSLAWRACFRGCSDVSCQLGELLKVLRVSQR